MLTNWLCLQEWELAGCISVLEELKKGKGGKEARHFCQGLLMLLPYWAEGMIKPSGEKEIWKLAHTRKLCCVSFPCVCLSECVQAYVCSWARRTVYVGCGNKLFWRWFLSIWHWWCVGVCYQYPKIAAASKMFSPSHLKKNLDKPY